MIVLVPVKTKEGDKYTKASVKIASDRWVWVRIGKDEKYLYRYSVEDIKQLEESK